MARRAPPRDLRREMALPLLQTMLPNLMAGQSDDMTTNEENIRTELGPHVALLYQGTHLHLVIFDAKLVKAEVPREGQILPDTGCQIILSQPTQPSTSTPWQRFRLQGHQPQLSSGSVPEEQQYLEGQHLALYSGRNYNILFYDPSVLDITWSSWDKVDRTVESVSVLMPSTGLSILPRVKLNQNRVRPMWIRFEQGTEVTSGEPSDRSKVSPLLAAGVRPQTLPVGSDVHPDTCGNPRHTASAASGSATADWPYYVGSEKKSVGTKDQPKQSSDLPPSDPSSSKTSPRNDIPPLQTDPRCRNGVYLNANFHRSDTRETASCGGCEMRRHSGDPVISNLRFAMNQVLLFGPRRRASIATFERVDIPRTCPPDTVPVTSVLANHPSVKTYKPSSGLSEKEREALALFEPVTPTGPTGSVPGTGVPWSIPGTCTASTSQSNRVVQSIPTSPSRSNQPAPAIPTTPSRSNQPTPPAPKSPLLLAALQGRLPISPITSRASAMSSTSPYQAKTSQSSDSKSTDQAEDVTKNVSRSQEMEVESEDSKDMSKENQTASEEKMDVETQKSSEETAPEKPVTRSGRSEIPKSVKPQESRSKPSTRSTTASPQKPSATKPDSLLKKALDGSSKFSRKESDPEIKVATPGRTKRSTRKGSESSEIESDTDAPTKTRVTRGAKDRKGSKSEISEDSGGESTPGASRTVRGTPRKTKASTSKDTDPGKGTPRKQAKAATAEGTSEELKGTPRKRGDSKSDDNSKKTSSDVATPRKSSRLKK